MKEKPKRLILDIKEKLHNEIKTEALLNKTTIRELVNQLITKYFKDKKWL